MTKRDIRYTVGFSHLEKQSPLEVGSIVTPDQFLGVMGDTGASQGVHLHIDVAEGLIESRWHVRDCEARRVIICPEQIDYFIAIGEDEGLFHCKPVVTHCFMSRAYELRQIKKHYGVDVVPEKIDFKNIFWNRTKKGIVLENGFDNGYGWYILIGY
jgi:murein DD-endopeptidase MepM/ murein hydrolase activator NlpD